MTDVTHNADDLESLVADLADKTFAQRVFIRENGVD